MSMQMCYDCGRMIDTDFHMMYEVEGDNVVCEPCVSDREELAEDIQGDDQFDADDLEDPVALDEYYNTREW